ncbi:MAG: ribbon-helix-helix domain-containing protein [Chloroflexota bacterium]|nr:ribbon-helix-helix domain-containing protein [Chloroflexota bacterium]
MPTSRRTTILADADLLERVDRLARRERTTKTAVIVAALEAWLEAHERSEPLTFVGIGRSGHGRLSLDGRSIARREMGRRETEPGSPRTVRPPASKG